MQYVTENLVLQKRFIMYKRKHPELPKIVETVNQQLDNDPLPLLKTDDPAIMLHTLSSDDPVDQLLLLLKLYMYITGKKIKIKDNNVLVIYQIYNNVYQLKVAIDETDIILQRYFVLEENETLNDVIRHFMNYAKWKAFRLYDVYAYFYDELREILKPFVQKLSDKIVENWRQFY